MTRVIAVLVGQSGGICGELWFFPTKDYVLGSYMRACLCDWRYRDVSAAELDRLVNIPSVHKSSEDIVPVAFILIPLNKRVRESRHR